jgi:hypothetical protein
VVEAVAYSKRTIDNEKEFRVALRHSRMGQRGIFPQVASLQGQTVGQ